MLQAVHSCWLGGEASVSLKAEGRRFDSASDTSRSVTDLRLTRPYAWPYAYAVYLVFMLVALPGLGGPVLTVPRCVRSARPRWSSKRRQPV